MMSKERSRMGLEFVSCELLAKVTYSVIPAKAGIQNCSKILDSGSRYACPEGMTTSSRFQEFCKRLMFLFLFQK